MENVFEPMENFNDDSEFIGISSLNRVKSRMDSYKINMQIALLNHILKKSGVSISSFEGLFGNLRNKLNQAIKKGRLNKTELKKVNSDLEDKIINALSIYKSKFGKVFELDLPLFITNENLRLVLKKQCETDKKNKFLFDPKKTRNRIRDCKMSIDSQIDSKYSNFEDDYSNFGLLERIKKTLENSKSRKNLRISLSEHPLNFLIDKTDLINIKGAIKTSNFDGDEYFDDDYSNFGLKEWFKSTFGKKDISTQSAPTSNVEDKKVFGMPRKVAIGVGAGLIVVGITAFLIMKKKK
jgi:hypothetical protein